VKLTTRALRTIKKHGGLDNYVKQSSSKILGWEGMRIRLKLREHTEGSTSTSAPVEAPIENGTVASGSNVAPLTSGAKAVRQKLKARKELRRVAEVPPTEGSARKARETAMKALGLESLPSSRQTIAYLKQHQKNLVRAARFPVRLMQ